MIVTQLNGGLGNQLFQYAIARKLALKNNTNVVLDTTWYANFELRTFGLANFSIPIKLVSTQNYRLFGMQIPLNIAHKVYYKLVHQISKPILITEDTMRYNASVVRVKNRYIYLQGYWQSEMYFEDIKHVLLQDLTIAKPLQGANLNTATIIKNSNSVALHIRRGDYVTNVHTLSVHGVCGLDYYQRAIQYITNHVQNPILFVFSDDIQWVKQNLYTTLPIHYVDNNDATTDYEDLRLMSLCKHNIIANSSFSWWGAWLNTNADKIVIAPSKWFVSNELNSTDIIPSAWVQL